MKPLFATAAAMLILLPACGNGKSQVESPTPLPNDDGGAEASDRVADAGHGNPPDARATSHDPWAEKVERPAGVKPIVPSAFVAFLGFKHGNRKNAFDGLLPAKQAALGKRTEIDMAGSKGYKYESHFAVAWDADSNRIEFVSIRSEEAVRYLKGKKRSDANLGVLWGISPGAAHGVLGKPTQVVNRPHAITYRYEFRDDDKRRGTVSLEFSKLADPVQCNSVSVHWFY